MSFLDFWAFCVGLTAAVQALRGRGPRVWELPSQGGLTKAQRHARDQSAYMARKKAAKENPEPAQRDPPSPQSPPKEALKKVLARRKWKTARHRGVALAVAGMEKTARKAKVSTLEGGLKAVLETVKPEVFRYSSIVAFRLLFSLSGVGGVAAGHTPG